MNTVILMWNPAISSYKIEQFKEELAAFDNPDMWYNWSVYDWQNSHEGDRFLSCKSRSCQHRYRDEWLFLIRTLHNG